LYIGTGGSARLTIASTGAATFSSSVDIAQSGTIRGYSGTTGAGMFLAYGSAGAGIGSIYSYNYSTSTYGGTVIDGSYVAFYNSGSEKVRITGGNVGIGTTSPSDKLVVEGSDNYITSKSTTNVAGFKMINTLGTSLMAQVNYSLVFDHLGTERMRITSGGNVLIGTTSDSGYKLDVNGTGRFSGNVDLITSSNVVFTLDALSTLTSAFIFKGSGTERGRISFSNSSTMVFSIGSSVSPYLSVVSTGAATFSSSVSATGFFETSDRTQKTLISDNVLIKGIENITAKTYLKNNKEEIGYFAQDFKGVLDSSINVGENGVLSLSYTQVHTAKIASLESRVKELENKLMKYEA